MTAIRKISAHYVLPGDRSPIRNGIIQLDQDGRIIKLEDPGGSLYESSRLEFYNGIITPGFVLPFQRDLPGNVAKKWGIQGLGLSLAGNEAAENPDILEQLRNAPFTLHVFLSLAFKPGADEFQVFHEGIEFCSRAWNEYEMPCIAVPGARYIMETGMPEQWLSFARSHFAILPLQGTARYPLEAQLERMVLARERVFGGESGPPATVIFLPDDPAAEPELIPGNAAGPEGIKLVPLLKKPTGDGSGDYLLNPELTHVRRDLREIPSNHQPIQPSTGQYNPILQMFIEAGTSPITRLLPSITSKPAAMLEMHELGSIAEGKKPGLNLISGVDPESMRIGPETALKKLV